VRDYSIFLLDAEGRITFWGEGARALEGWMQDEAEGAHLRLLYPDGGSEDGTAEEHLNAAIERGQYAGEGRRVRRDGSEFWCSVTIAALWSESGELVGFANVARDLTARREADALLTAAAAAAEAAREAAVANASARTEFLATISHEIRTPVNAILGYHELLELEIGGPLTDAQRSYIERATSGGQHLLAIVDEVLDFARLEAERVRLGRTAFRLGAVINDALGLVAPQARHRRIALTSAGAGNARQLAAWGDASRVRQILVNLLSNAIKFTEPRDGGEGRVTVGAGMAEQPSPDAAVLGNGTWTYFRVEDTGPGIPSHRLEAIFEPFVQADMSLTRRHGGTGLGLAISRRLARLMGGDLVARSEVGVGSTFLLWLPAAPLDAADQEVPDDGGTQPRPLRPPDVTAPWPVPGEAPSRTGALAEIADGILDELEPILRRYIERVREDPLTPSAHGAEWHRIEDHLASFLADLAATLGAMELPDRESTDALLDASAIQRTIAATHGAQRARLGWGEDEIRREFTIIGEELSFAVRRAAPRRVRDTNEREQEIRRAISLLEQFLAAAVRRSIGGYREARSRAEGSA
jgi:PAS domain S-box-containing protein